MVVRRGAGGCGPLVALLVVVVLAVGLIPAPAAAQGGAGGVVSVELTSAGTGVVRGSFEVVVEFDRAVSGLEAGDVVVVNGSVAALSGSGASYRIVVVPLADGVVVVWIPAGAAVDDAGMRNGVSSPLARTAVLSAGVSAPGAADPWIDTWDRAAVVRAYEEEFGREEPAPAYSGSVSGCVAGAVSQAFRDSELQRLNWYRRMAGVVAVAESVAYTADAQQAALMMAAEGDLSHYPPPSWSCYSASGARGALKSNLALGIAGIDAIDGYMRDSGRNNAAAGHRRWLLSPHVQGVGVGDAFGAATANALYVVGDLTAETGRVRELRDFQAWPPSGFLPAEVAWGRWSFTAFDESLWSGVDYSGARVSVVSDTGPRRVEIIHRGEPLTGPGPALVWAVDGDTDSDPIAAPTDGDECYTVTVAGVRIEGAVRDPYEYATCILDLTPAMPDPAPDSGGIPPAPDSAPDSDGSQTTPDHDSDPGVDLIPENTMMDDDSGAVAVDVRIAARRVTGGRVEFALQTRTPSGAWSEWLLPAARFFPTTAPAGRWLSSTPLSLGGDVLSDPNEVRIVARRVSSGRVEFALQTLTPSGAWSERLLPAARFFPTTAPAGRWLSSSLLTVLTVDFISY